MTLRIKAVQFSDSIRVINDSGASIFSFAQSDTYDIELVDFSRFLIWKKNTRKLLAIVPFQKSNYSQPLFGDDYKDLDEAVDQIESEDLFDDPLNSLPQLDEKKGKTKGMNGSKQSAASKDS